VTTHGPAHARRSGPALGRRARPAHAHRPAHARRPGPAHVRRDGPTHPDRPDTTHEPARRPAHARPARAAGVPSGGLILLVGLVAFITALDNTVVTIALPTIQRDLGLSLSGLEWVGTSYILAFGSQLLIGGHACDLLGRRRCLLLGLCLFGVASLAAAFAGSGAELIVARLVQGLGGAFALPAALSVVAVELPADRRELGAGVITAAIAVALALGPLVGGAVVEVSGWGAIFLLNLPVVVVAAVLVRRLVPVVAPQGPRPPVDLQGGASSAIVLAGVTWILVQGQAHGYFTAPVLVAAAVTPVAAVWFWISEQRAAHPLVELAMFRNRVFAGGTVAQVLWGLGVNGVFFFTSIFLQDVLGLPAARAGLAFVPLALAVVATVPLVPVLSAALGAARVVAAGLLLVALGLLALTRVPAHAGLAAVLPGLILIGAGSGLTTTLTTAMLESFTPERSGIAAATVSAAREMSGVLGITVLGAIVVARETTVRHAGGGPASAFLSGYRVGLGVAAGLVVVGAVVAAATLPGRSRSRSPAPETLISGEDAKESDMTATAAR
jgi:EmrB/QacA subfamily drug resistance transporter